MIRSTMRAILRRRLHDPETGGDYSNAELDEMLNVGLTLVEGEILKVKPYAFLQWETWDIVVGQVLYPLTVGTINIAYVGYRSSATGAFTRLEKKDLQQILANEVSGYAYAGRGIILSSDLTATAVADGLRAIHVPTLALADDTSSTEDKGLPRPLDMAAVVWTQELLLPETGEERKLVADERREMLSNLSLYVQDTDGPSALRVDLSKYPGLR